MQSFKVESFDFPSLKMSKSLTAVNFFFWSSLCLQVLWKDHMKLL